MLHVSILTSDRSRDPELWATVWQGKAPPTLKILAVYNLASHKRLFVWEGEGRRDIQYIDRLNQVGVLETYVAFDQTGGWQHAFAGDLEAMREWFGERGMSESQMAPAMDLRTQGHYAANPAAARKAARDWAAEQESLPPRKPADG
ncbi:MAG: hypothetical protein AB7J35_10745 [Dehalococcoidia bacterium]